MDSKEKQRLKKFIRQLEQIRGRHTELVSVYVPAGYELVKIIQHLQQEQGTAENIKSKENRKRVIDSLERMIRHLRLFKRTPENGLAAFAGNISETESKVDIEVFSIEPPEPINTRLYRCDQLFVLDILREMMDTKDIYGLIVLDNREANIGLLKGTAVTEILSMTSGVPGKIKAGGQCLMPGTAVEINKSMKEICSIKRGDVLSSYDFKKKKFIFSECTDAWRVKKKDILEIITEDGNNIQSSEDHTFFIKGNKQKLAGELTTKDFLLMIKGERLTPIKIDKINKLQKEAEMVDIEVKNKNFIANGILVHNSQQRFARLREIAAHEFYKRIGDAGNKEFLNKPEIKGVLIGGPGPTKETFFSGAYLNNEVKKKVLGLKDLSYTGDFGLRELVEKSQDLLAEAEVTKEKKLLERLFTALAKEPEKVAYGKEEVQQALEMGAVDMLFLSEDLEDYLIEAFQDLAEKTSTKVEIISLDIQEGQQLKELGGFAALLRFRIS